MIKLLKPVDVNFDNNYVYITFKGDSTMTYTIEKNKFEENTGLTVSNIEFPVPVYLISLSSYAESAEYDESIVISGNTTFSCGNIIDNLFLALKSKIDNVILIIDFDGITEVSDNFCKQYLQYLLTTKNKVITINQDINVTNIFAHYVIQNIELQELE